jgi:hypothetical protein
MLSTDSFISLIVGLGGLVVSIIGTIIGYLSYKQMKSCNNESELVQSNLEDTNTNFSSRAPDSATL